MRLERPDLRPERPDLRPERLDLSPERLEKLQRGDVRTDGRMDGRTYVIFRPLCPTGHRPFGAAAQKERNNSKNGASI